MRLSLTERATFTSKPTSTLNEIMATQSTSAADAQDIYEELEKYPWDKDNEFQVRNTLPVKSDYQPRLFPYSFSRLKA